MTTRDFAPGLAEEQALLLAHCHAVPGDIALAGNFPKTIPWILRLGQYPSQEVFGNSEAGKKLVALIKQYSLLEQSLNRLAGEWKATHLIHGDIKWINFMMAEQDGQPAQKLIDWELSDIGDPLWDVGGLLQSYLAAWLNGYDPAGDKVVRPEQLAPFKLEELQPSAQAFINKYMEARGYDNAEREAMLIRSIEYAAARILQTSLEAGSYLSAIDTASMRGLQLAYNIFKDPAHALREIFMIEI